MRKLTFLLILLLMLTLTGCPAPYEDTLQWEVKDGVLYLDDPDAPVTTDLHDMHRIYYQPQWDALRDEIETVVIGESIRAIGEDCFSGLSNLRRVQWHDDIIYIGSRAFAGTQLELESFPAGLLEIGDAAFLGCTLPEELIIPDHIEEVGYGAFAQCKGVKKWICTRGISGDMFSGCESLESVQLPEGITRIPTRAFQDCTNLRQINIPESVTDIYHAFENCTALEEIDLSAGVETIHANAFSGCTALKTVKTGPSLREIHEKAFIDCTALEEFYIPENLEVLGWRVFENCSSLSAFYVAQENPVFSADEQGILYTNEGKTLEQVPRAMTGILRVKEGVEQIAGGALDQTQLSEVILPETVTYLGASIMRDSTATSIYLPLSLTKIHEHAFVHNPKLQQILYAGTEAQWLQIENIEVLEGSYVLYEIPTPE